MTLVPPYRTPVRPYWIAHLKDGARWSADICKVCAGRYGTAPLLFWDAVLNNITASLRLGDKMAYNRIANIDKITMVSTGTPTNDTVVQTVDNLLCFTGRITNVTVAANATIFTIPNTFTPPDLPLVLAVPVYIYSGNQYAIKIFRLSTAGEFSCIEALNNTNVLLEGFVTNLDSTLYNSTIGNNDPSTMTSPLDWGL